jgi:thymidylate kinase
MFTVALIGPDGAGKTTIARQLEHSLPLPAKYLYMGVSLDSSNRMLPTTRVVHALKRAMGAAPDRAGPADPAAVRSRHTTGGKRAFSELKSVVRLLYRLSEEWFRQCLAWYYQLRGHVVLFDRHFFLDYYAYDIAHQDHAWPLARRMHGVVLQRLYPKPDLVIYLDAPAEVLFARKGEGSIALLDRRRQDYLQLREVVQTFSVVDASQSREAVVHEVRELIMSFYRARLSAGRKSQHAGG